MEIVVVLLTVTLGRLQQPEKSLSRKHKSRVIQISVLDLVYVAWMLHNISHGNQPTAILLQDANVSGGFRKC